MSVILVASLSVTPWDLAPACTSSPICPVVEFGYSQAKEDRFLAANFFCDVCPATIIRNDHKKKKSQKEIRNERFKAKPRQRTYVEIGALDGRVASNTLLFEQTLKFGGLLIEGQPENAARLQAFRGDFSWTSSKRRSVNHIVREAVCAGSGFVTYVGKGTTAGASKYMSEQYKQSWMNRLGGENYTVPCRPIGEMIRRAGFSHIDFFSLDVEGAELSVLQTMDWNVSVGLWLVEQDGSNEAKDGAVRKLLEKHGYERIDPLALDPTLDKERYHYKLWENEIYVPHNAVGLATMRRDYCKACIRAGRVAQVASLRAQSAKLEKDLKLTAQETAWLQTV